MTQVVYVGSYSAVVTADGTTFPNGEPVEVTEALATALVRQDFEIMVPVKKEGK